MARVLITEKLAERGLKALADAGHQADVQLDLDPEALLDAIVGAHALIVRSATQVTAEVLEAGTDLVVVGRAGIGLDNVDVDAATRRGVMVVNAPESNVLSAAEHAMALLLAQARNVPQANADLHAGRWNRWAQPPALARPGFHYARRSRRRRAAPTLRSEHRHETVRVEADPGCGAGRQGDRKTRG